jgi:predicted nucleic acid-binding protein
VPRATLASAIPPGASLVADTSVALNYLTGTEPTSALATELFDSFVATGRNTAALSVITVQEILVRPFRGGPAAVATAEGFLRHFAAIRLVEVTYDIAREAARIRAISGIRVPDALIIATALITMADVLVTNDRSWLLRSKAIAPGLTICLLADLARG